MNDSVLRTAAVGVLAGIVAGIFVAIPATAVAHAIALNVYQPTPLELAKSTCCGQVWPSYWSQVLPILNVGGFLVTALLGAALGVVYVIFRTVLPGPALLKAALFPILLALPFAFALPLRSPWESAFMFDPPYPLPSSSSLLLALPLVAAGVGIAVCVQILHPRLPHTSESVILTPVYGLLIALAGIGLLLLPLVTGLVQLGGD